MVARMERAKAAGTVGLILTLDWSFATARDWARFGLLYLRGGEWDGQQILSPEWVDDARTTQARDEDGAEYGAHWWTFAGGRINHTLKYALEVLGGWKITADSFALAVQFRRFAVPGTKLCA